MQIIKIKKGYTLNLAGRPRKPLAVRAPGALAGVAPHALAYVKLRPAVNLGQKVKTGDVLFFDKNEPRLKFLAPAAGEIVEISYGPRRVLHQIVIKRDADQTAVSFEAFDETALNALPRLRLVEHIAQGGLWYTLRELPFRKAAAMDSEPPCIFVSLDSLDPFQPDPLVYLKGREDLFEYGLKVLRKLCPKPPVLIINAANKELAARFANEEIMGFSGRYPAHDPGVLVYHAKKDESLNHAWFIDGQDLLHIARLLREGRYPTERVFAVGGVPAPCGHVKANIGASVSEITGFGERENWRVIAGSVFTGYLTKPGDFCGPQDKSFCVLNNGARQGRLFASLLFGLKAVSSFRTFVASWLPKRQRAFNSNTHGGLRACIDCNQCVKLCPVNILPNLTYKALLADEIEEALHHGLLDCAECGLCSYACPSKIELVEEFIKAKAAFYKEPA